MAIQHHPAAPPAYGRLLSLDAFRGMTIATMILVNTPGSWSHVYGPLRHAPWHGWTPTDLVFPFFLFIVGVAMSFSFSRHLSQGMPVKDLRVKLVRRALIIFGLGIFLAGYPFNIPFNGQELKTSFHMVDILKRFETIRVMGVLQRIAVCYLLAGFTVTATGRRGRLMTTIGLLAGYWLLMVLVPVPGFGRGDLSLEGNLARYIDLALLRANHMYSLGGVPFDPEGLLSTLPATATTLLGVFVGDYLRQSGDLRRKAATLLVAGMVGIAAGKVLSYGFPINKQIWTSSYVVFTAGWATLILGIMFWIVEVKGLKKVVQPFIVFGSNSIFVFVASGLVVKTIVRITVTYENQDLTFYTLLYKSIFVPLAGSLNGSLLFAVTWICVWLGILWILYWRRIFIKI
ncbi:MAG: acyltransferase family protein [Fidelibacterota bacterium]